MASLRFPTALFALTALWMAFAARVEAADPTEIPWQGGGILRAASVEAGRSHLNKSDVFARAMSRFDRQSRLGRAEDPGLDAVLEFAAAQVVAWDEAQLAKLAAAAQSLRGKLDALQLSIPWPREILVIQTTGREEGEAAYCRGPAIMLPTKVLARPPASLERLLAHELFHVLSNQNPELRAKLYAIIGFETGPEIPLPDSLRDRKLTNPDGPLVDCRMTLRDGPDGAIRHVAPILFANAERYDAVKGGSFFPYLTFRLLVVERAADGTWRAASQDGQPVLLDPKQTPGFHEQIGRNTGYIIHPDEVLADNFVHMAFQTPDLATPRIVTELRAALSKTSTGASGKSP